MSFLIYCHEDSSCSLKVMGKGSLLKFGDVVDAIRAARDLSSGGKSTLIVYNCVGAVILQTLV